MPSPADPNGTRNFWAWVAYQFFYRIGWQFKMESTMMAGIISYLTPSPLVMGLFTTLNNVGRNLSPLVASPLVDRFARKQRALLMMWGATVLTWVTLTIYLWLPVALDRSVAIWVFGCCYTLFFLFLGCVTVAQGALLGKVIPPDRRGHAMAMGMGISGAINVGAILVVYQLVRGGGFPEPRNYALAFTLTSVFFTLAGVAITQIREEPSEPQHRTFNPLSNFRYFVLLARGNRNLRRLLVVNMAVGVLGSMLQFYTGFWRQAGTMTDSALILATVFQVFWQSLAGALLGRVADRRGNRRVICALIWVEVLIPLSALVTGSVEPFRSHWQSFLLVYILIGARFPIFQLLVNYLLEIVPDKDHAMALGAVNSAQLISAASPILLGLVAGALGYPVAFLAGALVGLIGAWNALAMEEVRVVPT